MDLKQTIENEENGNKLKLSNYQNILNSRTKNGISNVTIETTKYVQKENEKEDVDKGFSNHERKEERIIQGR